MPEHIPANVEINVLIARSRDAANRTSYRLPLAVVVPDYDDWNDYGRNFFAELHTCSPDGEWNEHHIRMMFEGARRSASVFDALLAQHGDVFSIEEIEQPFVSLIPDTEGYRKVIEELGFAAGVSALRKMHDATVMRIEGENLEALRLTNSEEFHIGVLRASGAYDALRRGGRYFRASMLEPVDDIATNFVFGARLKCADNPYIVPFRFNQDRLFRDRIAVLIGRNGVGKTQLLKAIVDGLHNNHPDGFIRPHFQPVLRPSRVLVFSSVPTDPLPRAIGAWHEIDYEYFAVNSTSEENVDPLLAALVACIKADDRTDLGYNHDQSRKDVVKDALIRIGMWSGLHLPLRAPDDGAEELPVVFAEEQRYIPIRRRLSELNTLRLIQRIDWSRSAAVLDNNNQPRELSSGEYSMLRFAAQVASAIEQGSLLLFDEPETHLHPNFVADLMEVLDNLLQSTGSVAIVATHSAYVVRETARLRVNILRLSENEIQINNPRLQTFGASVDTLSQFVFGDTDYSHGFQKKLENWTDEVGIELGIDTVIEQFGKELNSESLSFIARRLRQQTEAD